MEHQLKSLAATIGAIAAKALEPVVEINGTPVTVDGAAASNDEPLAPVVVFTIIPVKNAGPRIRIEHDSMRAYMYHSMDLDRLISHNHLIQENDPEHLKNMRRQACTHSVSAYFNFLEDLKAVDADDIDDYDDLSIEQFKSFVDVVQGEFDRYIQGAKEAFETGETTFELLNTALNVPGQHLAFTKDGGIVGFITKNSIVAQSMGGPYIRATGEIYVDHGKGITKAEVPILFGYFSGKQSLKDLGLYNLAADEVTSQYLLQRGEKYLELTAKPAYVQCSGSVVRRSYWGPRYFQATGRVMIDMAGMRRVDTNYGDYFAYDRYSEREENAKDYVKAADMTVQQKQCLSPFVYGFSLISKVWGEFDIDQLSPISFRTDAFDKLVLDEDIKDLVFSLVDTEYTESTDLIDGKGGGCIFLLEGPPGVGKTLTAEAVAEKQHRPLYMVGVGELGTDVDSLEASLKRILETASAWNAVLLIDEADIFLAERSDLHIERNAMVGVFLRLLEYFPGIMFLTTNLAGSIDKAFYSRISLAIHYDSLTNQSRETIWKTLLGKNAIPDANGVVNFTPFDIQLLATHDLNGRQIKNAIRNGSALAKSKGRAVTLADIQRVIGVTNKFQQSMNEKLLPTQVERV